MNSIFLNPPGISSFCDEGNSEQRIGEQIVRNARMLAIDKIEKAIRKFAPLPISVDTTSAEPPYFSYFSYCDILGGVLLQTGSAEITARIALLNQTDNVEVNKQFDVNLAFDKYGLRGAEQVLPPLDKVFFTPGSNLLHVIDPSGLAKLADDEDWFVKPHPISQQPTLIEFGRFFGYNRVLNNLLSGHEVFNACREVATTQASEFYVLAGLTGKKIVDLTKHHHAWTLAYQQFGVVKSDDIEENKTRMHRALMHPNSGFVHPSMSDLEIDMRISNYFNLAMSLRQPFKMVSTQRLFGRINTIAQWETPQASKQGPRLPMEQS